MRNIVKINLILLFSCLAFHSLFSQSEGEVKLIGTFDISTQGVKLRWAPGSIQAWEAGLEKGYTLIRYTYADDNSVLTLEDYIETETVIDSFVFYLPENEWDTLAADSNVIGFAMASLFDDSLEVVIEGGSDMLNAYNLMNVRETKYNFGLLAADRSFEVAQFMGLAYVDTNVVAGHTYDYKIYINADTLTEAFDLGWCRVQTDSIPALTPPGFRAGYGMNTTVFLEWAEEEAAGYLGYYLERSDDMGVTYSPLNSLPLATILKEEGNVQVYGTVDSVPAFLTTYVYRVRGVNLWGETGPWSDTLHISTLPPRVAVSPDLFNAEEMYATDEILLEWNFPDSLENKIERFLVLRSENRDGPYDTLAANVPVTVREWYDNSPVNTAHYKIRAVDIYGYSYDSYKMLFQKNDVTPPAAPSSLNGSCDKSGLVSLSWASPTDRDVAGYRVFSTYNKTGDWAEHTTAPVRDSSFSFFIDIKKLNREVFVKVQAVDLRANYSAFSDTLSVEIPDIIAPASPQLLSLGQQPFGQVIEFKRSPSGDVAFHTIERRNEFISVWEPIDTIATWQTGGFFTVADSAKGIFIDTTKLRSEPYSYRVLAVDDAENRSSSAIQEIVAHQVGRRPEVSPVTVVSFVVNGNTFSCLRWDYESAEQFQDFVIYRKVNNHPYKSYKATAGTTGELNVTWPGLTPPSGSGTYLFVDLLTDDQGNLYGSSEPLESVRYRIVGRHYDGSSSPHSQVVGLEF